MKVSALASKMVLLSTLGMFSMATTASADDAATLRSETRRMDTLATSQGSARVQGRLVTQFSGFAGSEANAQSLVTGLRSGTPVTLTSTSTTGGTTTTTAFTLDPPTRPMGYGNVFISLALAKQQLANYGITDPTPQEIQAALTGGTITTGSGTAAQTITLKGILTQRADGMGWGNIARSQGMNLGRVVSGLKSANQQVTASTVSGVAAGSGSQTQTQTTTNTTAAQHRSPNAQTRGAFSSDTSGIVNAGGNGVGAGANANAQAGVRAGGAGIVTGSGAAITARGGVNVQGQGRGLSKP